MTPGIYLWECNVQPAFSRQLAIFLMELDFSLHTKQLVTPGNLNFKWSIKVLIKVCVVFIATCMDTHTSTKNVKKGVFP